MRINRAIGLILFLLVAKVILGEVFNAVSGTVVASMETLETASHTATAHLGRIE